MSLAHAIGRNTLLQVVGKGIATVLGLITVAILQRSLGPESYGGYTAVMAYMGFFSVIADFGLYLIVLREIAKEGADTEKIIGNALSLRIVAAVFILLIGIGISFFLPYDGDVRIGIAIIAISFFFVAIQQVLVSVFQHALKMMSVVVGEISGRIVLLALVWYVASTDPTLTSVLLAVVAGSFVNALIVFFQGRKIVPLSLRFDFAYWKYILRESWPIAISIVLNLLYFRLDTIFLSVFRPLEEVGLYGAAYKILEILVTFPNMFIGLIMPILSGFAFVNWDRFKVVFQRSFDALLIAVLPLFVGGFVLARELVIFVGGEAYADATVFFRMLLFAIVFLFFGSLSGHTVTAINEQRKMVWAYLGVAVVGVVLYLVLIPSYGAYGAALGTIVTEGFIMIAGYIMIYKRAHVRPQFTFFWKALFASAIMGGVLYFAKSLHILLAVSIGVVVYACIAYSIKLISKQDIMQIFSKQNKS